MKKIEIKRTVEELVGMKYIAEDGTEFYNEEECKMYEESALFVIGNKLKRLNTEHHTSHFDLIGEGSDDCCVEIFDVQTEDDLENLKRYLYLKAIKNGANEEYLKKDCFTSIDGKRKDYVFDSVTIGHEVIIFWNYEEDSFWVYKDGSLDGYFEWLKERYAKIIATKEDK